MKTKEYTDLRGNSYEDYVRTRYGAEPCNIIVRWRLYMSFYTVGFRIVKYV